MAGHRARSPRLRARGRRGDPGRDPGPRRQLRSAHARDDMKTCAPSPPRLVLARPPRRRPALRAHGPASARCWSCAAPARGKCWEVAIDGRLMERFSRIEEAVEAVDYEIERIGRGAVLSAAAEAAWRRAAPPVAGEAPGPPAANLAEALRLSVWHRLRPASMNRPGKVSPRSPQVTGTKPTRDVHKAALGRQRQTLLGVQRSSPSQAPSSSFVFSETTSCGNRGSIS